MRRLTDLEITSDVVQANADIMLQRGQAASTAHLDGDKKAYKGDGGWRYPSGYRPDSDSDAQDMTPVTFREKRLAAKAARQRAKSLEIEDIQYFIGQTWDQTIGARDLDGPKPEGVPGATKAKRGPLGSGPRVNYYPPKAGDIENLGNVGFDKRLRSERRGPIDRHRGLKANKKFNKLEAKKGRLISEVEATAQGQDKASRKVQSKIRRKTVQAEKLRNRLS